MIKNLVLRLCRGNYGCVLLILFVGLMSLPAIAQVTPAEGSILNYRVIGCSFPARQKITEYQIQIAYGKFINIAEFTTHIKQTITSAHNKAIIEVPEFGNAYTWRVVYKKEGSVIETGKLCHFSTGIIPANTTGNKRLRVINNSGKFVSNYILVDGSNTIYDIQGQPIWYLPGGDSISMGSDVKISPDGTITFLANEDAYDINYKGKILWHAKSNRDFNGHALSEYTCHHELNKLNNGHYMLLLALKQNQEQKRVKEPGRIRFFPPLNSSTLAEFDKDGNIIWSWESSKYMQQSDLWALQEHFPKMSFDLHENAFYYNERDSVIFLGLSGINRVVKIKYPSGIVMKEYGSKISASSLVNSDTLEQNFLKVEPYLYNSLFAHQHALTCDEDGSLYMFNNNNFIPGVNEVAGGNYANILKLKESGNELQKEWDFNTKLILNDRRLMSGGSAGGNVVVLPDGNIFVSMSTPYGDIFIADINKNIVWSAFYEVFQPNENTWSESPKYRASIISRQQLEGLIWRSIKMK